MADASDKVDLQHDISINGVKYTAGRQDVPKEVSEDLRRMDRDATQAELNLHRKRTYESRLPDMGNSN